VRIRDSSSEAGPAWAVVVYWLLSIAQYSFRYILKVNDTHTSGFGYSDTPWYLSAIKHVITAGFLAYCIGCRLRSRENTRRRVDILSSIYSLALAVGVLILGIKVIGRDGRSYEMLQAWLQTWPYLIIPLLLPACMRPAQAVPTLKAFSLGAFIITGLFWIATVYLYYTEGRYPALSWPGQLRFGGILDDPNGYAALMVLLIALTIAFRGKLWLCRLTICLVMSVMTRSLAGFVVLIVMLTVLAIQTISQMRGLSITAALKGVGLLIGVLIALCLPSVQSALDTFASEVNDTLQFKQKSIDLHLSDLVSPPDLGADADAVDWLVGSTGVSENFYSWTLINFGILGSLFLASCVIAAIAVLANRATGAGLYILAWAAGIIIGSAGIPYFRNFPVNMLFWTTISVVIQGMPVRAYRQAAGYGIAMLARSRP
jgi:hypothetical protein